MAGELETLLLVFNLEPRLGLSMGEVVAVMLLGGVPQLKHMQRAMVLNLGLIIRRALDLEWTI